MRRMIYGNTVHMTSLCVLSLHFMSLFFFIFVTFVIFHVSGNFGMFDMCYVINVGCMFF